MANNMKWGRPRKDGVRDKVIRIRCSDGDIKKLNDICENRGLTVSEAVQKALDIYNTLTKYALDSVYD